MGRTTSLVLGGLLLLSFALYEIFSSEHIPGAQLKTPFQKSEAMERGPASAAKTSSSDELEDSEPSAFFYCSGSEVSALGIDEVELGIANRTLKWVQLRFSDFSEAQINEPFRIEGERYSVGMEFPEGGSLDSVLWDFDKSKLFLIHRGAGGNWLTASTSCSKN